MFLSHIIVLIIRLSRCRFVNNSFHSNAYIITLAPKPEEWGQEYPAVLSMNTALFTFIRAETSHTHNTYIRIYLKPKTADNGGFRRGKPAPSLPRLEVHTYPIVRLGRQAMKPVFCFRDGQSRCSFIHVLQ